jgi:hypothetical protein
MNYPQSKNIFISYFLRSRLLFFLLTIVSLFYCFIVFFHIPSYAQISDDKDAIAIRVIPNSQNYSPQRWYKDQGFKGSPQSLTVDGYEAIRDGRTVYVNAANVVDTDNDGQPDKLFTNIYLISYNQEAEKETIDIFAQILEHWKFNTNITGTGLCSEPKEAKLTASDCAGAIGCWHFDGDAKDSSGNANNGTVNGATLTTDRFGNLNSAYSFDGINDYIEINNNSSLDFGYQNFSIGFWIKLPQTHQQLEIISKRSFCSAGPFFDVRVKPSDEESLNLEISDNILAGFPASEEVFTQTSNDGEWHFITFTREGNKMKSYIDNNFTGEKVLARNYNVSNNASLKIGNGPCVNADSTKFLNGSIDDIRIYNRALSADEIKTEFNKTSKNCLTNSDCSGSGYCSSPKANIVRDTKRLSDLVELKAAIENYKAKNGKYPSLSAGSYLTGKTVSTWPSWQGTLGKELGATLPKDPVNKLGVCAGFDPATCWSEKDKKFADPDIGNSIFELPTGSNAFVYTSDPSGNSYGICSVMQSEYVQSTGACSQSANVFIGDTPTNKAPRFLGQNIPLGKTGDEYIGYISASDPDGDPLKWTINTVGPDWAGKGWSAPPVLQNSAAVNQKKIFAQKTGLPGDYNISITINDNKGEINSINAINLTIKVINPAPVIIGARNISYTPTRTAGGITPIDFSFQVKDSPTNYPLEIITAPSVGTVVPGFNQTFVRSANTDYYLYRITGFPGASPANIFNSSSGDNIKSFKITVRDKYGAESSVDLDITVKNAAPQLNVPAASCSDTIRANNPYSTP